jgi:hypothetical protein
MTFKGDFSYDEVISDPLGAVRWASDSWREVNFVQGAQANYDLYHCRDKIFESEQEEFQPKTVFPLAKLLVNEIADKATSSYLRPGSFVGVARDVSLFPMEDGPTQDELDSAAMGAGMLIEQDFRHFANSAINFPLWSRNASLAGSAMMACGWKTELRRMPVEGGTQVRKQVKINNQTKSILLPQTKEMVVRESIHLQALAPGTWGVDPEASCMSDLVWGWTEDFLPASVVIQGAKDKYYDLVNAKELERTLGSGHQNFGQEDERIMFFKHQFEEEEFQIYFGQSTNRPFDRICVRSFYTKELRIHCIGNTVLKIEYNPYSMLRDGFPFEVLTYNGTGSVLGVSDLYYLKPYLNEYNKLRNAESYNAEMESDPGWTTTERNVETLEDFKNRGPGSLIFSNQGAEAFVPIPHNPISPEVRAFRLGILDDAYLIAGINPTTLGSTPPPNVRSNNQQQTLAQEGAGRLSVALLAVNQAMSSLGNKALCQYQTFLSETKVVKLFGEKANAFTVIGPEHFGAVHEINIESAVDQEQKISQNFGNLLNLLPVISQFPNYNPIPLVNRLIRHAGINPDALAAPGAAPLIPPNGGANATQQASAGPGNVPSFAPPGTPPAFAGPDQGTIN